MNYCLTKQVIASFKRFRTYLPLMVTPAVLGGIFQSPAFAQTQMQCIAAGEQGPRLSNQVDYTYSDTVNALVPRLFEGTSNTLTDIITRSGLLVIESQGARDEDNKLIFGMGAIADALKYQLMNHGFSEDDAIKGSLAAIRALIVMPDTSTLQESIETIKNTVAQTLPSQASVMTASNRRLDQDIAIALTGLTSPALQSLGFTEAETETAQQTIQTVITRATGDVRLNQVIQTTFEATISAVPTRATLLADAQRALAADRLASQPGTDPHLQAGDTLRFQFLLQSTGTAPLEVYLPTASTLQRTGLTGPASVTAVSLEGHNTLPDRLTLRPGQQVTLVIEVKVDSVPKDAAVMAIALGSDCGSFTGQQQVTVLPPIAPPALVDPFGRITGCNGETLPDYEGFSVGLYEPEAGDSTGNVRGAIRLTPTELPDNTSNRIPKGIEPNTTNSNPFFLTNDDEGEYSFLLDPQRGQLDSGQTYILLINPPENSGYSQRRIRIILGNRQGSTLAYTATTLDGRPISATNRRNSVSGTINIVDAEQTGLILVALDLDTGVCQAQSIQITKTGDRAAAEPGDTVIYRLSIRSLATAPLDNLTVTDRLPLGFVFQEESVRSELNGQSLPITTTREGATVTFQINGMLPPEQVLNIAYAAQLTPDAVRGDGRNSASVRANRFDNDWVVRDGPAIYGLRIQPGIVSDCGTIIGRVFVDRNFDGEQQSGEPGVPNAVILMDDGNRITTDADGLFSVANALPGYRTGALDLSYLPGYTLAPNHRFIERNSPSRLVHLEPGGMVRMNFAVTPTAQEEGQ